MSIVRKSLIVVTAVGLFVDAYIHLKLASSYDIISATVSQGQLFRLEAALAILAAMLLIFMPNRLTALFATLVAGGGMLALLLYYYVNVGPIGPLPNMYDPIWYTEKAITAVAQTIATVSALTLVILYWPKHYSTSAIESTKVVAHV